MDKITISEHMKHDFLEYSRERKARNSKLDYNYDYLTENILSNMFDYMVKHKLTVHDNAKSYIIRNGKKDIFCYGYSGYSINERDNIAGMIENLYHETFCKAEWLARGIKSFYIDIVKEYFGREYKSLTA
jgi:hypothetical protein